MSQHYTGPVDKWLTRWGMFCLVGWFLALIYLGCAWALREPPAPNHRDDSDPPNGHSGFNVYIDNRTGCEYVGFDGGALTPRRDRSGHQICEGV